MEKASQKKSVASPISEAVEKRIVALSLQNPGYGPRRLLPLLTEAAMHVSVSSTYNILKRHGLETRDKRLLKLTERQAMETPPPHIIETPLTAEVLEPLPDVAAAISALPRKSTVPRTRVK